MRKLSDLARRADFSMGPLLISPARRRIEGPAGQVNLEPIIMQVFLMLVDARGQVVTRAELFDQCWGGTIVGDDSLNRAVGKVRKALDDVAPGLSEVETIPRTGYRLVGEALFVEPENGELPARSSRIPRRAVIVGTLAVAAAGAGGFGMWSMRSREDRRFKELMDRGEQALRGDTHSSKIMKYFQQAAALRPDNARAQGLLAYTQGQASETSAGAGAGANVDGTERAARIALSLQPDEPNARLALTLLQRSTLDFEATEDRLRAILATAPDNILVMRNLWNLLQSVGRSRDALALVERAIAVEPLAANNHFPRAQLLWIVGRNAEADRIIDKAMEYWPSHRFVRFARFTILAFTDRPRAALAMLEKEQTTPQNFTPAAVALWRVSLAALDQRTPASIEAARRANMDAARQTLALSSQAILALSKLGEIDAAFEIANQLLLYRGAVALSPQAGSASPPAKSTAWRFAPWLFTPPVASLWADPRFDSLCDGIGLTEYWRKRGVTADYRLART